METLLPNVNTSEGCFDIGVLLSNFPELLFLNLVFSESVNDFSICTDDDGFSYNG